MAVSAILAVKLLQIPSPCETCILKESGDNVLSVIVMSPSWSCVSITSLFRIVAGVMVYDFVIHHIAI